MVVLYYVVVSPLVRLIKSLVDMQYINWNRDGGFVFLSLSSASRVANVQVLPLILTGFPPVKARSKLAWVELCMKDTVSRKRLHHMGN